jgi:hypothetical protein
MAGDFQQRDMSGALFKNDKGDNDRRPDYRGDCNIGGVTYRISAWVKEARNGTKFMSLAFDEDQGDDQRPREGETRQRQPSRGGRPRQTSDAPEDFGSPQFKDSSIPF